MSARDGDWVTLTTASEESKQCRFALMKSERPNQVRETAWQRPTVIQRTLYSYLLASVWSLNWIKSNSSPSHVLNPGSSLFNHPGFVCAFHWGSRFPLFMKIMGRQVYRILKWSKRASGHFQTSTFTCMCHSGPLMIFHSFLQHPYRNLENKNTS